MSTARRPATPRILYLPRRRQVIRRRPQAALCGQECAPPVVLLNSGERTAASEEWRFQSEMLRAECNFLRTEGQFAVKKSEKERDFMENTIKSALHSLITARRKVGEGQNVNLVLEEEIQEIAKKLVEIQRSAKGTSKGHELLKTNTANDEETTLLHKNHERAMDEKRQSEKNTCGGHCRVIVKRIMEQVRAETEQWPQMQEMLSHVRAEMDELQASRDFWEARALDSDYKLQSLNATAEEWKEKALSLEKEQKQLQEQLVSLSMEEKPKDEEKRALMCRVKGKMMVKRDGSRVASPNREPFREIGNIPPPLLRQKSKRWIFP